LSDETIAKLEEYETMKEAEKERLKKAEEAEKKKAADDNAALLKRIETLEKKGRSDTTQLKDDEDDKDKKVKKKDEPFDWTSLNPKPEKK
jgi:hypothetical protein